MQTIDPPLTLGGIDFAHRFENVNIKRDSFEFQPTAFDRDW